MEQQGPVCSYSERIGEGGCVARADPGQAASGLPGMVRWWLYGDCRSPVQGNVLS